MDRLLSLFSLYDLLGFILPGGLLVGGTYWAVADSPPEPGAAAVLAVIAAFFIAGELVQGLAVMWERVYWNRFGWPSQELIAADGDDDLRELVIGRLVAERGENARALSAASHFEIARASLRRVGLDGRSELMNARYALARGLATATALLLVVFVVVAIWGDHERNAIAAAVACGALPIFVFRFHRFGRWFALQVWRDYAALPIEQESHTAP